MKRASPASWSGGPPSSRAGSPARRRRIRERPHRPLIAVRGPADVVVVVAADLRLVVVVLGAVGRRGRVDGPGASSWWSSSRDSSRSRSGAWSTGVEVGSFVDDAAGDGRC